MFDVLALRGSGGGAACKGGTTGEPAGTELGLKPVALGGEGCWPGWIGGTIGGGTDAEGAGAGEPIEFLVEAEPGRGNMEGMCNGALSSCLRWTSPDFVV